jgi:hypothetical protein
MRLGIFDQSLEYVVPPRWVRANALRGRSLYLLAAVNTKLAHQQLGLIGHPIQVDRPRKPMMPLEMLLYVAPSDLVGAVGAFDVQRKRTPPNQSRFEASDDAECIAVVLDPRNAFAALVIEHKVSDEEARIVLHQKDNAIVLSGFNVDQRAALRGRRLGLLDDPNDEAVPLLELRKSGFDHDRRANAFRRHVGSIHARMFVPRRPQRRIDPDAAAVVAYEVNLTAAIGAAR